MKTVSLIIKQLLDDKSLSFFSNLIQVEEESDHSIILPDFDDFLEEEEAMDSTPPETPAVDHSKNLELHFRALEKDLRGFQKAVVIMGAHSSGKTTLFNQITGLHLPTGFSENTGGLVECAVAKKKGLRVYFQDGTVEPKEDSPPMPYTKKTLAQMVDKFAQQEHGKVFDKEISKVRIFHPFKNLNPDVLLVDTPGINGLSYSKLFEEITLPYLRQLPNHKTKVIWVQDLVKAETSAIEFEVLSNLSEFGKSVLFVGTNYDNYLLSGHWKELMKQMESPIYKDNFGNRASLKDLFGYNIYINTLVGKDTQYRRIDEPETESRSKLSKSLISQWIGTDWHEAKYLFQSNMNKFRLALEEVDEVLTSPLNEEISTCMSGLKDEFLKSEAFDQMHKQCYQQIYQILEEASDLNDESELEFNRKLLVLDKEWLTAISQTIQTESLVFCNGVLENLYSKIRNYVQEIEMDISHQMTFFSLINEISCRRFLQEQEAIILKLLQSQFKKLKKAILKGKYRAKHPLRIDVRQVYFNEDQFTFLLDWFSDFELQYATLMRSLRNQALQEKLT